MKSKVFDYNVISAKCDSCFHAQICDDSWIVPDYICLKEKDMTDGKNCSSYEKLDCYSCEYDKSVGYHDKRAESDKCKECVGLMGREGYCSHGVATNQFKEKTHDEYGAFRPM